MVNPKMDNKAGYGASNPKQKAEIKIGAICRIIDLKEKMY